MNSIYLIERTPLVESTVRAIFEYIKKEEMQMGEKLPAEMAICKKLNISRATLREAYRVLQARRILELKPGRGAFVYRTNDSDEELYISEWFTTHEKELHEYFEVRMAIEPLAIRLAIERAKDSELLEVLGIAEMFSNSVETDDRTKMAIFDEMLHNQIVSAAHNKALCSINKKLSKTIAAYRSNSFSIKGNGEHAVNLHNEIARSLYERNFLNANKALLNHLEISLNDIQKTVSEKL